MTTSETLLASVEISSNQLAEQVRQFEAVVADPDLRAELADKLDDLAEALRLYVPVLRFPVPRNSLRACALLSKHQQQTQPHPQRN